MKYIKQFEAVNKRYNTDEFFPFVTWFNNLHKDEMKEEGWLIVNAGCINIPKYIDTEYYCDKNNDYWQIQRNDEDEILKSDIEAEELAKKKGLMIDDYGVLIGYNGVSFFKHPEELEVYKNANKYNL